MLPQSGAVAPPLPQTTTRPVAAPRPAAALRAGLFPWVPVCLSASHIAMTSIRMEPVWMILGESAGVAAAMAVAGRLPVQQIDITSLQGKLRDLGQKLAR